MLLRNQHSKIRKITGIALTALGWIFLILFLYIVGSNIKFEWNSHFFSLSFVNMNAVILFTFLLGVISFLGLHIWGNYNKRRYGQLRRRTFPAPTLLDEMENYYSISASEIVQLQEEIFINK